MRVLLLPVGEGTWCVPLAAVREVLTVPQTTCLPTARASVLGLFNLRGSVLPLFDTAALLGQRGPAAAHVAVVEVAAGLAGLTATGTPRTALLGRVVSAPEHPAALGTYDVLPAAEQDARGADAAVLLDLERLLG